jgi:hypothetical protein
MKKILPLKWSKPLRPDLVEKLNSHPSMYTVERGYSGQISCLTLNSAKADVFISLQYVDIY